MTVFVCSFVSAYFARRARAAREARRRRAAAGAAAELLLEGPRGSRARWPGAGTGSPGMLPGFPSRRSSPLGTGFTSTAFLFILGVHGAVGPGGGGGERPACRSPAAGESVNLAGEAGVRGMAARARPAGKLRRSGGEGGDEARPARARRPRAGAEAASPAFPSVPPPRDTPYLLPGPSASRAPRPRPLGGPSPTCCLALLRVKPRDPGPLGRLSPGACSLDDRF